MDIKDAFRNSDNLFVIIKEDQQIKEAVFAAKSVVEIFEYISELLFTDGELDEDSKWEFNYAAKNDILPMFSNINQDEVYINEVENELCDLLGLFYIDTPYILRLEKLEHRSD